MQYAKELMQMFKMLGGDSTLSKRDMCMIEVVWKCATDVVAMDLLEYEEELLKIPYEPSSKCVTRVIDGFFARRRRLPRPIVRGVPSPCWGRWDTDAHHQIYFNKVVDEMTSALKRGEKYKKGD
jgi:hypothetical protein